MRRLIATMGIPLVAVTGLVACTPEAPPATGPTTTTSAPASTTSTTTVPRQVLEKGHADVFEVTVDGATLRVQVKDDTHTASPATVYREPDEVILRVAGGPGPLGAEIAVPDPAGPYTFLGAPGSPVWLLPQVQNPNLLWPGLSTERIGAGVLQGNTVNWIVDSVSGPGSFHLYNTSAFGTPSVKFTSAQPWPQTLASPVGSHAHFTWAFGALGTYTLNFRATATLADGTPVTSGPVPYTFVVGDLPA